MDILKDFVDKTVGISRFGFYAKRGKKEIYPPTKINDRHTGPSPVSHHIGFYGFIAIGCYYDEGAADNYCPVLDGGFSLCF
ncbi:hypothetical protein [Chitinophaga varians]|uniref:hypothetical protein n=1 Tax=Chitinophaga varians TaxID=2202339 RepID=UPI001FFC6120|nr:hypothetical protein [Chitinophaga varians]